MYENTKPKRRFLNLSNLGLIVLLLLTVLLVAALGTSYYFYTKLHTDPQKSAEQDLQQTMKLVSRHLVLPKDEVPTMATVSDPLKLRDQPFFANAQKGDKVLIYSNSQKAILYNPTSDRIVEVAPINTSSGAPAAR